ncbi:hypothetical protein MSUIS_05880 [Mycoplasma suis KI3806]|uniref:Uncharacterized protein n=1 Tax=Mycoplasma suis (strain KI_3806) TaxID=708248 RepID=F0V200_MYCS3|nr:hypothetical protein [Mycoplasma suis]CBZ40681.1 hypothetical protein MSUIS_05880 [Mycoplasma suis KI3806]
MSHLTLGSIILGSAVGFPSSEKIANTIFTRKEVQEEIEQKIAEDKEREEREFLWKYIYSDNTSSYICDFWIKSEERGKKKKSIDCEKLFSESINF